MFIKAVGGTVLLASAILCIMGYYLASVVVLIGGMFLFFALALANAAGNADEAMERYLEDHSR